MRSKIAISFILFLQIFSSFSLIRTQVTNSLTVNYQNGRFWDIEVDRCFFYQETRNSCVSASIQMVLRYLDFSPLPNQTQLAMEMHTDINHTTQWKYTDIPFKKRGFLEFYKGSLSEDFDRALVNLKGNVSRTFPVIIKAWYNEQAKSEGDVTHASVVTGYNSTGIFIHDPWSGPNRFMSYSAFSNLWETDSGYWALIVQHDPRFDLIVEAKDWLQTPISEVEFTLIGEINRTEVTDFNGIAKFSNLTIANYVLRYDWRFQSQDYEITLTKTTQVYYSLFLSDQTIFIVIILAALLVITAMIFAAVT